MELRFFVGYGLELSRIVPLIIFHIKRKYLCKTETELKEAWAPGDQEEVPLLLCNSSNNYSIWCRILWPRMAYSPESGEA